MNSLVMDSQPLWLAQAAQLMAALRPLCKDWPLEHIGSTAVPGLCAKPVLDLMLGLPDLTRVPDLQPLGWRYRPEHEAEIPERRYFSREPQGGLPRAHLHALLLGGEAWRRHLAFRDALRSRVDWREAYAALKRQLAGLSKAEYQARKSPFITTCLAELQLGR